LAAAATANIQKQPEYRYGCTLAKTLSGLQRATAATATTTCNSNSNNLLQLVSWQRKPNSKVQ